MLKIVCSIAKFAPVFFGASWVLAYSTSVNANHDNNTQLVSADQVTSVSQLSDVQATDWTRKLGRYYSWYGAKGNKFQHQRTGTR